MNIHQLKNQYGRIFSARVKRGLYNEVIYFRLISKKEYDNYSLMLTNDRWNPDAEEYLLSTAIVNDHVPTFDDLTPTAICRAIIKHSGFSKFEDFASILKKKRTEANTLIEQIMGFISKAFPTYKISDLENMNYEEIARLLALSEAMMGTRLNIPGAEIEDDALVPPTEQQQPRGIIGDKIPTAGTELSERDIQIASNVRDQALEVLQKSRRARQKG